MLRQLWIATVVLPAIFGAPAGNDDKKGQIWAVLVAGSSGFFNYRHQADVCHAYQIFRRNGIPDSNIIVMMYDDIANNAKNPKKGIIINNPNGTDVYKHVPKDYTDVDVTPEHFVNVLTGNEEALVGVGSGKVLKSGPNDHVFVNFVDHGSTGMIGFPDDIMYADTLIKALKKMNKQKMYKKLVFYMEACESGSMFNKILPNNINIFATTAANPDESSYACYWDDTLEAYLGDAYSVSWMEDIDTAEHSKNFTGETLHKQFRDVVNRVTTSHPQMYGEKTLQKDHVMEFVGDDKKVSYRGESELRSTGSFKDSISSREVALETLNRKLKLAKNVAEKEELQKQKDALVMGRQKVDELIKGILMHVTELTVSEVENLETSRPTLSMEMMPCYRTLVDNFSKTCVNVNKNTYTLGHLFKFANLCLSKHTTKEVLGAFAAECTDEHRAFSGVN